MKFQIMLRILFRLLKNRKASARELARENGVSERSIYRYAEELIVSGVPLDIVRGRGGGIFLPDTYKLPENFFTREEYAAAVNALGALYEQLHDDAAKSALDKLALQQKADSRNMSFSGNIVVDGGTWGDAYDFSEKLRVLEDAAERCECLDICYIDRGGKESRRIVEAHLLVYKQNIWYLYAWCRTRRDFRLFRIGAHPQCAADGRTVRKAGDRPRQPAPQIRFRKYRTHRREALRSAEGGARRGGMAGRGQHPRGRERNFCRGNPGPRARCSSPNF